MCLLVCLLHFSCSSALFAPSKTVFLCAYRSLCHLIFVVSQPIPVSFFLSFSLHCLKSTQTATRSGKQKEVVLKVYFETRKNRQNHCPCQRCYISFARKGIPLVQDGLVLVVEVVPFRNAVFGFQAREREGAKGIFSSKDYARSLKMVSLSLRISPGGGV